MLRPLSVPLIYSNYRNSCIYGDVKITKLNTNNKKKYDYKFHVKLGVNSSIETMKYDEIKYEKLSEWVCKHFSSHTQSYDCIMELSNNSKFIIKIVNAKVTSKCILFYVNSTKTNAIFNADANNSFKLPLKTLLNNVKFCIFEKFNLEDNLNIINANQQFLSNNLNNVKNGQLISITKAGTILKNSIKLPGSDIQTCPEQNITVYKVLYWSSQNEQNGPQMVSGSILVPENVSNIEILQTRHGSQHRFLDRSVIWYSIENNLDFNVTTTFNKSPLLFSGLGYIVVHADGFGFGVSEGRVSGNSDFDSEVYLHVDILRAVRTTLRLFSPKVSIEPLHIIYCGYSGGAVYAPSIVNNFVPGNNQTISLDEASKFSYTRMILGGCPCITNNFFKLIKDNPKNNLVLLEIFGLLSFIIGHSNSGIMMSRPSAYNQMCRSIQTNNLPASNNSFTQQVLFSRLLSLNTIVYPPSLNDPYTPANNIVGDIRQIFNVDNAFLYSTEFTDMHGWTNLNMRLDMLPPIPTTMVYAASDQVVAPVVGNEQSAIFKKIFNLPLSDNESAYVYDGAEYLDDYMGEGKLLGGPIRQPGANKIVTVNNELNDLTQSGVKQIASLIRNTTGNNYVRIKIEPQNCRDLSLQNLTFGRGSHNGNTGSVITWMESTYYALQ
jgi:hypothetical protein